MKVQVTITAELNEDTIAEKTEQGYTIAGIIKEFSKQLQLKEHDYLFDYTVDSVTVDSVREVE